jgi:hypothetical protein
MEDANAGPTPPPARGPADDIVVFQAGNQATCRECGATVDKGGLFHLEQRDRFASPAPTSTTSSSCRAATPP